jgi:hypothetical protein
MRSYIIFQTALLWIYTIFNTAYSLFKLVTQITDDEQFDD